MRFWEGDIFQKAAEDISPKLYFGEDDFGSVFPQNRFWEKSIPKNKLIFGSLRMSNQYQEVISTQRLTEEQPDYWRTQICRGRTIKDAAKKKSLQNPKRSVDFLETSNLLTEIF